MTYREALVKSLETEKGTLREDIPFGLGYSLFTLNISAVTMYIASAVIRERIINGGENPFAITKSEVEKVSMEMLKVIDGINDRVIDEHGKVFKEVTEYLAHILNTEIPNDLENEWYKMSNLIHIFNQYCRMKAEEEEIEGGTHE